MQAYGTHDMLILYIVLEVICVFVISLLIDKLLILLLGKLENRVISEIVGIANIIWLKSVSKWNHILS